MAVSLTPTTLFEESPDPTYSALDTGVWTDATVATLNSADVNIFTNAKLGASAGWSERYWFATYELSAPMLLEAVKSVTVRALLDSYSGNTQAVDLSLELFLQIGFSRYVATAQAVSGSTPTTGRRFREFEATWSLNPATGVPFAASDLAAGAIYAGIRARCATDPFGASINLTGTGLCCQLLEVEVEGPAGASVEVVRHVLSSHLLRHRKMFKTTSVEVALQYGDVGILKPIEYAGDGQPTPDGLGSGPQAPRRALYLVLQKTPLLQKRRWRLELLDPRTFTRSYWSPLVTNITADAQDTGIARFDQGGGWSTVRAQTGYVRRPPEGLWKDRAPNTPRYHKDYGLLICGGGQRWSANNTFSQGFGGPGPLGLGIGLGYTGWSFVPDVGIPWDQGSTEAVRTEELFELLFDIDGIRRGVKLHDGYRPGNPDAPIYATYTWAGISATRKVRGFMKYRPDYFGPSRPKWMLVRNGSSYFVPGTGWSGTPTWNAPDQFGVAGTGPGISSEWEEFWTEEIDVGGSPATLEWRCGYSAHVSSVPTTGPQTVIFGASGLVESNGNARCFPREFLVTTSADAIQAADNIDISNDLGHRVWDVARGTLHFNVTWGWRHADLVNGDVKELLSCLHRTTSGTRQDRLYYERVDAATGRLVFRRHNSAGATHDSIYTLTGANLPAFLRTDKIGLRWTSSLGELGLTNQTHSVWWNRLKGTDGVVASTLPTQLDGETKVRLGRAQGSTNDQYADCYLKNLEVYPWCLTDAEIRRAMNY